MAYSLEPSEGLLRPEYWDGIDIGNPDQFQVPLVDGNYTTRKEHRAALTVITACLTAVASGDYTEVKTQGPEFNPSAERVDDGTVVVLDQEHLMKWTYPPGREREWKESTRPSSPRIESPFAEYWRKNQARTGDNRHFGDEEAIYPELHISYGRFLSWGVLLSREDGTRLLETWGLAVPKMSEARLTMPASYFNKVLHRAETLPLVVGQAVAKSTLQMPECSIYAIDRLREVHIVHPANAPRQERKLSLAEQLREAVERLRSLGRIALPKPIPVPVRA